MMSKKHSKKKKKEIPSSPSGSEHETSRERDGTRKHKGHKMKEPGSCRDRPAERRQKDGSPTGRSVSKSSTNKDRHFKKASYRLLKTPGSDRTPDGKETKRKSCSSQATSSVPGRGAVVSADEAPGRRLSEKSCETNPSKAPKRSVSPGSLRPELEEHKRFLMKECSPKPPPKAEKDRTSTKSQEELMEKRRRHERRRLHDREKVFMDKRNLCSGANLSPVSSVESRSSTSSDKISASQTSYKSSTSSDKTSALQKSYKSSTSSVKYSASQMSKRNLCSGANLSPVSSVESRSSTSSDKISASQTSYKSSTSSDKTSALQKSYKSSTSSVKYSASQMSSESSTSSDKNSASQMSSESSTSSDKNSASQTSSKSSTSSDKNSASQTSSKSSTSSAKNSASQTSSKSSTSSAKHFALQTSSKSSTSSDKNSALQMSSESSTSSDKNSASQTSSKSSTSSDKNSGSQTSSKSSTSSDKNSASQTSSNVSEHLTQKQGKATQLFQKAKSLFAQVKIIPTKPAVSPNLRFSFKIPKKIRPLSLDTATREKYKNRTFSANESLSMASRVRGTEPADTGSSVKRAEEGRVPDVLCSAAVSSTPQLERKGDGSTVSGQSMTLTCNNTSPWISQTLIQDDGPSTSTQIYENDQEMQLVETLHQARSENELEVQLVEKYGELTSMDIDLPVDTPSPISSISSESPQQILIIVLDTNILLSHLDYVKHMISHGLGAMGLPVILVPWVVLQELDSLKHARRKLFDSVAHLATPAVQFIYCCLKEKEPRLWGQSMQQAAQCKYVLIGENNDDRVLQCCLQYQNLYPGGELILCTNDKNLCSKAILSGVKALNKVDLEADVARCPSGLSSLTPGPAPWPHAPALNQTCTQTQHLPRTMNQDRNQDQDPVPWEGSQNWPRVNEGVTAEDRERRTSLTSCRVVLEDCLKEALSVVLEVEMKAAFGDLWEEIVLVKPPWSLRDILQCLQKHWIAVFGSVVPRHHLQTVLNLIDFLYKGKTVDESSHMVTAICHSQELLRAFGRRSTYDGRVPSALSSLDGLTQRLLPQPEKVQQCSLSDAVMCGDEQNLAPPPGVSQEEVWTLFDTMWCSLLASRSAVLSGAGLDISTMQRISEGDSNALTCLPILHTIVTELLQAISRVLSPDSGLDESQELLSLIRSSEIVPVDTRFTGKDLLECFSQQESREKLRIGGDQLTDLKVSLERCAKAVGQPFILPTWH